MLRLALAGLFELSEFRKWSPKPLEITDVSSSPAVVIDSSIGRWQSGDIISALQSEVQILWASDSNALDHAVFLAVALLVELYLASSSSRKDVKTGGSSSSLLDCKHRKLSRRKSGIGQRAIFLNTNATLCTTLGTSNHVNVARAWQPAILPKGLPTALSDLGFRRPSLQPFRKIGSSPRGLDPSPFLFFVCFFLTSIFLFYQQ